MCSSYGHSSWNWLRIRLAPPALSWKSVCKRRVVPEQRLAGWPAFQFSVCGYYSRHSSRCTFNQPRVNLRLDSVRVGRHRSGDPLRRISGSREKAHRRGVFHRSVLPCTLYLQCPHLGEIQFSTICASSTPLGFILPQAIHSRKSKGGVDPRRDHANPSCSFGGWYPPNLENPACTSRLSLKPFPRGDSIL